MPLNREYIEMPPRTLSYRRETDMFTSPGYTDDAITTLRLSPLLHHLPHLG